jgi:cyclic beta-1,2-glucan synthetase
VREELFGVERLEEHARSLALSQPVTSISKGRKLSGRLADNAAELFDAYLFIAKSIDAGQAITPAAEWLVDNYHLVEMQIREVRSDLPPGYYRQLPKLADGPFAGYPRVFGLAWAIVAHTDSNFDPDLMCSVVKTYQEVQPLTIGELWAVAITLRIVLIENLRRLASKIVRSSSARRQADGLADCLLQLDDESADLLKALLAEYDRQPMVDAFAVQLVHRLHDTDSRIIPALSWLEERLAAQGTNVDAVVRKEHQRQGAANVTVRNIITSMRLISEVDWKDLFERMSLVDVELSASGSFAEADFPTRNLYRSAIETLARDSKSNEIDIARRAVSAGRAAAEGPGAPDNHHIDPGHYLIGNGRRAFEKSLGYRRPLRVLLGRLARKAGIGGYVAAGAAVAILLLAIPLAVLAASGVTAQWLALLALMGFIPATDLSVALVNQAVTRSLGATLLPALELDEGIPSHLRTVVAVPTLLTTLEAIPEQIRRLETHYLASAEGELHFALLTDWTDADTEQVKGDEALLNAAANGIAELNLRHGPAPGGARFLLLHRRRVWSATERQWIGWERKRGKLHELNRLLRGATDTTFLQTGACSTAVPRDVRYVITLDADTRLPHDTVHRLIGKMAHPLNRPCYDPAVGRIVDGYGIMQPRVTASLPIEDGGSLFQRIFSSAGGVDPYPAAVSDVYQDLVGEGSYTGKGIYDVDAFETALAGRTPDEAILSHDLFEGVFARVGLASDVEVVEDFPARYEVAAERTHRWTRGDWQLLPWVLGRGPVAGLRWTRCRMPASGRWKMLDNLRRTSSAPMTVIALVAGWTLPLHDAVIWTLFIVATIMAPTLIPVCTGIVPRHRGLSLHCHIRALGEDLRLALIQTALITTLLAHQAAQMADAITRTLLRLYFTRKFLLEWVPAEQAARGLGQGLLDYQRRMLGAPLIGLLALAIAWLAGHGAWALALPFAMLWMASPAIARWSSQPSVRIERLPATEGDILSLRLIARRTWRYFETFVSPEDNMLPPDNFQEDPSPAVAHRTSPTNIGLYLLSVASAKDLGWIGVNEAADRLEATLAAMQAMARFHGHFYNWYDTQDLRPLTPAYISAVDSGNLAGHLIAVANACVEWRTAPISGSRSLAGVLDALELTRIEAGFLRAALPASSMGWVRFNDACAALAEAVRATPIEAEDFVDRLAGLAVHADAIADIARALPLDSADVDGSDMLFWVEAIRRSIESTLRDLRQSSDAGSVMTNRLLAIEAQVRTLALDMDFNFLLDTKRKLLSIGYLVPEGRLDPNCYDLLASEACLASFMAIAKGDVPTSQWFRLGRAVTPTGHGAALISWSGSMFEYLMPSLVLRAPTGSLIGRTNALIVDRQIEYATGLGLPWGVSESAYNVRDSEFTYQYSNFGVPGLGLKRGLEENTVIAPYATGLAAMIDPHAAAANFDRLASVGGRGRYGFYEALDYTPSRVPLGTNVAIVRAFMAHHQGMTIVSIANALLDGPMRTRFHAEAAVQATELLLQERTPREVAVNRPLAAVPRTGVRALEIGTADNRRFTSAHTDTPATHMLSNGQYAVMVTAAGSGYSRWKDISVTRWREDATSDDWGSYVFVRDVRSGRTWSAGYQPVGREPDAYYVEFNEDRAEFARRDGRLTTTLRVNVSAEDNAEVRRVTISNSDSVARDVEITSYAELVLAPQAADVAHPAFSKLFVETEYVEDLGVILATRRPRHPDEQKIWAAHLAVVDGATIGEPEIETDRVRFLGRGGSLRAAAAMTDGAALSGTVGTVLDPIFALRRRLRVAPGATATIAFWTVVADSRDEALNLVDKHRDAESFERAAMLAWTQARVQMYHLGINQSDAALFQRLAGHIIYAAPALRSSSDRIRDGAGAKSGLWKHGISGDLPIVLLRISEVEHLSVAHQLLQSAEYWRLKMLNADLVILNERGSSYVQDLQVAIETHARITHPGLQGGNEGAAGKVFFLRGDLISGVDRDLLISVARVVLVAARGRLSDQLERIGGADALAPPAPKPRSGRRDLSAALHRPELELFNGLGGFADDGREYVTILGPGQSTPAPWINVVSNRIFGFQVAAEGSGYTWAGNSRENQLTPWSNDPVADRSGESFYLRDEDTGDVWSATAHPVRDNEATYVARHARGYSRFEHASHGITASLLQYVPLDDPIKISRLELRNTSGRARRLSVTAYAEWILGPARGASQPYVITEIDPETAAMFARNPWNQGFGTRIAFADLGGKTRDWTADRREFIGRNGALANPAALAGTAPLSNKVGAGLDPCAALRTFVDLPPGGAVELVCFLGQTATVEEARRLIVRYRTADLDAVLRDVRDYWDDILGAVQVTTPDRAMDIMLNGWLLYQSLACRIWARSAFYQASGAFGFRDQIQDVMSLLFVRPQIAREHLLRAAARQFIEGDVQHWWLPHSGEGVRTRISDDRAWLAYAVAHYVDVTGDTAILDEMIPFLRGPELKADEHDSFFLPVISGEAASLFEHCARALNHSLATGRHGLPLMGSGDWNDGMNRVGQKGQGESVWLGWLLDVALKSFAQIAAARGRMDLAQRWREHAGRLESAIEREAWDGDWYRRAWFDDGAALGSAANDECRIDSIAQSWAVISGAADPDRAARAMSAVEKQLINTEDRLALLFTPPFDKTDLDPGYIKGYPPGVRENGGQYSHAAMWSIIAFTKLGEGDKAAALFSLLNPINHARTPAEVERYKVEPYVVAADVYSTPPHVGRGGWTWYTGSAGWMYRAGIENILGLQVQAGHLRLDPCIPKAWPSFRISLRHRSARYEILVENPDHVSSGIASAHVDGVAVDHLPLRLPLVDDGAAHRVLVKLG